jgi:glycosyltransferase involved in cell wall biosynthesis
MIQISIIMSTYCRNRPNGDCPNLLRRAIDSILAQTFIDWEFILIDDGSKDGSEKVCREYALKDARIRYVRFEENSGCPARRYNDGMKMAQSPYFMYMFDDDYLYPHAMQCLYEAKTKTFPQCGMVYGLADYVDAKTGEKKMGFGEPWNMEVLSNRNILGNLSVIVPRTTINTVGGYDENPILRRWCDWDLWKRIGMKFPVERVSVSVGCVMHSSPDSIYKTVRLSDDDTKKISEIQTIQCRHVRLQGEISLVETTTKPSIELGGKKVCMVMAYTPQNPKFDKMGRFASAVNMEYCRKHGYGFRLYTSGFAKDRHPSWSKILFIRDTLKTYPWVMWIDTDSVITNPNITLDRFLDDRFMLVVGKQDWNIPPWNSINFGVFFARSEPLTEEFLDKVWSNKIREGDIGWEQASVRGVMRIEPFKQRINVVCRREFNSIVPHESLMLPKEFNHDTESWHKGDFVAHYGGIRNDTTEAMSAMLADRETKSIVFVTHNHDPMQQRWTVRYLSEALKPLGIKSQVVDFALVGGKVACEAICRAADVVVVFKCFHPDVIDMMRRLRAQGKFMVFFIDDYLFQRGCKYTGGGLTLEPLMIADALMSPSSFLLSKMPFDKPKILRRNVLDEAGMTALKQTYRRNPAVFSVGFTMAPSRGAEMDWFMEAMLGELDVGVKDGEKIVCHYFGKKSFHPRSRIELKEHEAFDRADWRGFYAKLVSLDLGVVANPMDEKNEYWHSKSELKFVECGAMGVPLVTVRVPPYTEFLKEGENGFFASTPKEFAEKILVVMRDEALSRRVSEKTSAQVREQYDIRANAEKFLKDLTKARMRGEDRSEITTPVEKVVVPVYVDQDMKERTRVLNQRATESAKVAKLIMDDWMAAARAKAASGGR